MKNNSLRMLVAGALMLATIGSNRAEALTVEDLNVKWVEMPELNNLPIYKLTDEQRIRCTGRAFESHPEIPYELGMESPERVDFLYNCISEALAKASARKERIKQAKKNKNKIKNKIKDKHTVSK